MNQLPPGCEESSVLNISIQEELRSVEAHVHQSGLIWSIDRCTIYASHPYTAQKSVNHKVSAATFRQRL